MERTLYKHIIDGLEMDQVIRQTMNIPWCPDTFMRRMSFII